jgi:hypothetical protein
MRRFRSASYYTSSKARTTGGIKQKGMDNISENGRGARVALCAHPFILILILNWRTEKNVE